MLIQCIMCRESSLEEVQYEYQTHWPYVVSLGKQSGARTHQELSNICYPSGSSVRRCTLEFLALQVDLGTEKL